MQFFLALAAIVGAFAFGVGVLVIDRVEARAARLATQAAADEAAVIAAMIGSEMSRTGGDMRTVASRFEHERMHGGHLSVELFDASGKSVFPTRPVIDDGTVSVEAPIHVARRRVGSVRVVKPTVVMRLLLADFAPTVLVISLVLGAAAALAAAWIGRAIAAPIEALSVFSERVSDGERTGAPPPVFGREVTRLRQSIDSMRRQLEGRPFVETFAADLSHELKNPVAAIRASAEVLDESALEDPQAARRFVARILEAAGRIERLLQELLSLASLEARGVEGFAAVDTAALARAAASSLGDDRRRIEVHVDGDVRVRGEAAWLGRAIGNLVDNANVHSRPESPIALRVFREHDDVIVSVVNEGAVPPHVSARAFSRFVTTRADKGGTGLGLAIVRAVAEAHAGRAELFRPGPGEVEFRLILPAARGLGGVPASEASPAVPVANRS